MKRTNKIRSYFHPVTVELTGSKLNPILEVILSGGKYSLNSMNTNYSFGSLHTLFKKLFRRLKLNWSKIDDVLLLGFGTGSVAAIIDSYKKDCRIDGVEIDEKVIELGRKYFKTGTFRNLIVHNSSAEQYIRNTKKSYDLIVIDVYRDIDVPAEIETEDFLIEIRNALRPGGIVVFNKLIYSKKTSDQVIILKNLYQKLFGEVRILKIMITSRMFIAKK